MFIAEPPPTRFDLRFQVLGFPVRVHPLFWLVALLIGFGGDTRDENLGLHLVLWFCAMFVSILVHELGHALMIRRFGRPAYIVLYAMGGLAIEGRPRWQDSYGSPWSFDAYTEYRPERRLPMEQILISAAGPGIQFLLAGLVAIALLATGGGVTVEFENLLPLAVPRLGGALQGNENLWWLAWYMLQINILWPLLNLLPVLPLDGGQIALQVLVQRDPWSGMQRALWLSMMTAAAMAVFALVAMQSGFTMLLFASLAASSYFTLQQAGGGRRPW